MDGWMTIIFGLLALAAVLRCILYRRQIREICRQLRFINSSQTNKLIATELNTQAVRQLAEELNRLLEEKRKKELLYCKKDRQLKETIMNISHDIRTPLTSLDGYFQLLMKEEEAVQREQYASVIDGRIRSLKEILEQLFTYIKLQDPEFALEEECCNLTQILSETIFSFYENFKAQGLEPSIQLPEQLIFITANEIGLRRVLQNIMKNILDHRGREIEILLQQMEEQDKMEAVLEVRNRIMEGEVPDVSRIFERFYTENRSRSSTTPETGASAGLGLFIAKELTEKMGGEISAKTEKHSFILRLSFQITKDIPVREGYREPYFNCRG